MGKRKQKANQEPSLGNPMVPKRIGVLVEEWAEEACNLYDLVLFDVTTSKGWLIRIFVDTKLDEIGKGIDVADCVKVSRYVEALLDEVEGVFEGYNLEVSSPGIERKLSKPKHFTLSLGKTAKIVVKPAIDGETVFKGTIENFEDEIITISTKKGDKEIPFKSVSKAKLTFQF